jgi:hypothetical protein
VATRTPTRGVGGWRLRPGLREHLGSPHVARLIYGAIIGLALVEALEHHPPPPAAVAATLVGSAVAVGLAEAYSELVVADASTRPGGGPHIRRVLGESCTVVLGAGFPAIFFVLAAADAMEETTAFTLATWTGLGLIVAYGFVAARLAGAGAAAALLKAAAIGAVGGIVIALKAFLH